MIAIQSKHDEPYLVMNNKTIARNKARFESYPREYYFELIDDEIISEIRKTPFNEFSLSNESAYDVSINFSFSLDISITGVTGTAYFYKEYSKSYFSIGIDYSLQGEKWKNRFSIEEFLSEIKKSVTLQSDIKIIIEPEGYCFNFICPISSNNNIEVYLYKANVITTNTVNELLIQNRTNSLTSIFEFPEHLRTTCEQYLIYFAEFLSNIGIRATTEITHQASSVLFTVVPQSKDIALINIQKALGIYLQLPSQLNDIGYISFPNDPQVQQLIANVQHFKSQILLLNATIQMQAQTIERQQTIINQQQKFLDVTILQTSLVEMSSSEKVEDKEELLGGIITLTKLELKGIELNIANIYRWLRNKFKRD